MAEAHRRFLDYYRLHMLEKRIHAWQCANGKAERFIRTMLSGWAYGAIYGTSVNAPPRLTAGYGPTTIAAHTVRSAITRTSLASTS